MRRGWGLSLAMVSVGTGGYLAGRALAPAAVPVAPEPTAEADQCTGLVGRFNQLREDYLALQANPPNACAPARGDATGPGSGARDAAASGEPAPGSGAQASTATGVTEDTGGPAAAGEATQETALAEAAMRQAGEAAPAGDAAPEPLAEAALLGDPARIAKEAAKATGDRQRRNFLGRVALRDPRGLLDRMPPVDPKNRDLEALLGVYRGPIVYLDQKRRDRGYVRLEVRLPGDPPWEWAVKVDVHEKKGVAQRKTGGLETLHTLGQGSRGYLLRSSERSYLQLYLQPDEQQLVGNFYEADRSGTYHRTGTARLKRAED